MSTKDNQEEGHYFLQYLIENDKVMDLNTLLKAYVLKTMNWSVFSLQTLLMICHHTTLPETLIEFSSNISCEKSNMTPLETQLLEWVSNISWKKILTLDSIKIISQLFIGLTLKSWNRNTITISKESSVLINGSMQNLGNHTELETCYLASKFCINIFSESDNLKYFDSEELKNSHKEPLKHFHNKKHLNALYLQLENILKPTNKSESVRILIVQCALIARVITDLIEIGAIENDLSNVPLMPLFEQNLEKIFKFLSDTDLTILQHKNTLHMMKTLRILFQVTTNRSINQILINSSADNVKALQNLYSFLQSRESVDISVRSQELTITNDTDFIGNDKLREQSYNEEERKSTAKTLILYCCVPTENELIGIQENLLQSLLNSDGYNFKSSKDIEVILNILEIISNSEISIHTQQSVETITNLLEQLFPYLYKNQENAQQLLIWLPKFLKIAIKFEYVCHLLNIVRYFQELLQEKKDAPRKQSYGPSMHINFLKCLKQMIVIDSSLKFLTQNESIIDYLLDYINSSFYIVRLEAARCVFQLFSSKNIDYEWKMNFFEKLKLKLNDAFVISMKLENFEKSDELMTRGASMLYIISAIFYGCNFFKLPALFTLVYLAAEKGVDAKNVKKILKIFTKDKGNNETIVEKNLDYLLISWWNIKESFAQFPWDVTYCSTENDFYNDFMHMLLPVLIQTENLNQALILCNQQEFRFERELERSFPKIIAWLLSKVTKNSDTTLKNILRNLESNQKEFRSVRRFIDLLHENLDRVIISLIESLHDETFLNLPNVKFPVTKFIRLVANDVDNCLLYMENNFFLSGKLMHILANERRDVLQKVLLQLTRNIYDNCDEFKLKAFHQFFYFCNAIAGELKSIQFNEIAQFLIRDICSTLLYQIDDGNKFTEVICNYFYKFLQMFLPERYEMFKDIFIFCVKILTRRVNKNDKSSAFCSLEFLIVGQKNIFADVIQNLDFFPNSPVFEEMRKIHKSLRYNSQDTNSLKTEIIHFLNINAEKNFTGTESLIRLRNQLSSRRKELKELYKQLESLRGFAEDCASSKLHKLIHKLTKLMKSSEPEVSEEAAKCLGLLGPGNLSTMILLPEQINRIEANNKLEMLTYKILIFLADLINDRNIEIREASANASYVVLSSYWGRILINENYLKAFEGAMNSNELQNLLHYIRPFITKSNVTDSTEIVLLEICSDLKDDSWIENACNIYENWIKKFSCIIANCYRNFFMKSIIPIFNLSVKFCEKLVPLMVDVLHDDSRLFNKTCAFINRFFHYHFVVGDDNSLFTKSDERGNPKCSYESVHCMLNIVNFIWIQSKRSTSLNFDYLSIAKGAQFCSAYFTSVLYAELWCESFICDFRCYVTDTVIDYILEVNPISGKILQDIIREAYVKIGDPDAIHGCGSMHLLDSASRIRHYVDLKQWDKAILMQDIELSCGIESTRGKQNNFFYFYRVATS